MNATFEFTEIMTVTFVLDYATITAGIYGPGVDSEEFAAKMANELVRQQYGFEPMKLSPSEITVSNEYGDSIEV